MKLEKARKRDKKRYKKKHGHRTTGRKVFTWQEELRKRLDRLKNRGKK